MRHLIVAAAVAGLSGPACAESFNFASGQVVTHRGNDLVLNIGTNKIDRKNQMTCTSDTGCSLVIETQFINDQERDSYDLYGIACTYVDSVAADPGCVLEEPHVPLWVSRASLPCQKGPILFTRPFSSHPMGTNIIY
jgi:hypothetical protein